MYHAQGYCGRPRFHGLLPAGRLFDLETPYGYGGPLTDAPLSPEAQQIFMEELRAYCLEQRIVTQFLRYHRCWIITPQSRP